MLKQLTIFFSVFTTFLISTCSTGAFALDVKTFIPEKANTYLPLVKNEQETWFSDHPEPYYFAGLIEHESCITLTHKRCWDPQSRLKTSREEGAGLGQLTRAYRTDGSVRFDALTDIRQRHRDALGDISWSNVYSRPDLQVRSMIFLYKDNYRLLYKVDDPKERIKFADAAYNGGIGHTLKERTVCGLKANCDPGIWFGNTELTCVKSTKPLYGGRSACDINRHHVYDVFYNRMPKYRPYFDKQTENL